MISASDEQLINELGLRRRHRWSLYDHPNLIRAASILFFLVVWEIYGRETDPILFTYPTAFAEPFLNFLATGELLRQAAVSLGALAAGFGLSLVLGVGLGLAMGRSRLAEAIFEPHVNALYATPQVALTPLLMMWLGLGFAVKVAVLFLFAFFPILIKTASGAKYDNASIDEVVRGYPASGR